MNSETNHLIDVDILKPTPGYDPLPPELYAAAIAKLAGRAEATIARHSGGKLSRYAAQQRRAKAKAARQTQRRSRARNR